MSDDHAIELEKVNAVLRRQNNDLRRLLRHLLDDHGKREHWAWQEARDLLAEPTDG